MPRGGARPGAGRPKGSKNKRPTITSDRIAAAMSEEPLEYLLRVMRDERADIGRRCAAAIAAAPYVHPRAGDAATPEKP